MKKEIKLTREQQLIIDLVMQGCDVRERKTVWEIDNLCLSTYEQATSYLMEIGVLKNKRRNRIYTMSKKIKF